MVIYRACMTITVDRVSRNHNLSLGEITYRLLSQGFFFLEGVVSMPENYKYIDGPFGAKGIDIHNALMATKHGASCEWQGCKNRAKYVWENRAGKLTLLCEACNKAILERIPGCDHGAKCINGRAKRYEV